VSAPVIEVVDLKKTYRTPLRRKLVRAVEGVTFSVAPGEIFGFLGPNGAGKTTTIRILMGLIAPSSGVARIFGEVVPSRAARTRLGFLPESPYFYDYLTVAELCDLAGRLFGIDAATRRKRAGELIELVGLERARKQPLKSYSKGMLQRAGIAQALMNDPDLVVLDEPMTGLDPIGRKEVRDIMVHLRERGKTVFFSTHILADVEALADRVAIVARGRLVDFGTLGELVDTSVKTVDVTLRCADDLALAPLEALALKLRRSAGQASATLAADADVDGFLAEARTLGARVVAVEPKHESLEDLFLRRADEADQRGKAEAAGRAP
jgi:ABC-2 type transport system ATP-binding protein